ncbi:GntR family transcriptional regulator [Pseudonocardia kunmingensis]|uniref:GntR family transcriptional regulator n=1 Tax=Pseudonocardia kunmingensis TaxID=630975 RepID=UPI001152ED2F|nr:GntR family transcriptional regulator [Pseudonocardia kunmingensis]
MSDVVVSAARFRLGSSTFGANDLAASSTAADDLDEPGSRYQRIAADLRAAIRCGALSAGDLIPTIKTIAGRYRCLAQRRIGRRI